MEWPSLDVVVDYGRRSVVVWPTLVVFLFSFVGLDGGYLRR